MSTIETLRAMRDAAGGRGDADAVRALTEAIGALSKESYSIKTTAGEFRCLEVVYRLSADGRCPSYEQVGAELGVSKQRVNQYVIALRRKGFIVDQRLIISGKGLVALGQPDICMVCGRSELLEAAQ